MNVPGVIYSTSEYGNVVRDGYGFELDVPAPRMCLDRSSRTLLTSPTRTSVVRCSGRGRRRGARRRDCSAPRSWSTVTTAACGCRRVSRRIQVVVLVARAGEGAGDQAASLVEDLTRVGIRAELDPHTDVSVGRRIVDWELRGVPVRVELGPRDIAAGQVPVALRARGEKKLTRSTAGARDPRDPAGRAGRAAAPSEGASGPAHESGRTIEEAIEQARVGAARVPWAALGPDGERRLLEDGISVKGRQTKHPGHSPRHGSRRPNRTLDGSRRGRRTAVRSVTELRADLRPDAPLTAMGPSLRVGRDTWGELQEAAG